MQVFKAHQEKWLAATSVKIIIGGPAPFVATARWKRSAPLPWS